MAELFSQRKRSEAMSRIRGRGDKDTELTLATLLRAHRISGWRRNQPVFGKPVFVFPRHELNVLVDGCSWHGCPQQATWRANRATWWRRNLLGSQARDALVTRTLWRKGWGVLWIWEHELARQPRGDRPAAQLASSRFLISLRRALASRFTKRGNFPPCMR
jgi:DNA mismatch endonuclease (patch repair protein)